MIADSNGDLFGTASGGGGAPNGPAFVQAGTVFEIVKTSSGYASTPTALVDFDGAVGALVTGGDGQGPAAGLLADAKGDLFGTTQFGGANLDGTVFEIKRTAAGYASTPTTLATFNGENGANPYPA